MINLTDILQTAIALIGAIITYKLIPWLKARTTESQQNVLLAVTRTLVFAAEQLYGAGKGPEKLAWVEEELAKRGYTVDTAAIESMVRELASAAGEQKAQE